MRHAVSILVISLAAAQPAAAHFGPAEPPEFGTFECISVVDLRTTQELMLPYEIGYDDVGPEEGHILLPDSKTHQFFAFRGAVVLWLPRFDYLPFAKHEPKPLPVWIDNDDVKRAEAAFDPSHVIHFQPEAIGDNYLHTRPDITGQWVQITERMPITVERSTQGARWALAGVAPGVYQVASYTFSPPYNAWQPRPGLIKLVDGSQDPPAVALDSIDGMAFSSQGFRVTGCVDAEPGSTLSVAYSVDGEAISEWRPWQAAMPVASGPLNLCFGGLDPLLSGLIRLRVSIKTPSGLESFAYSPDTLVLVAGAAACSPSQARCCEPVRAPEMLPPSAAGAAAGVAVAGSAAGSAVGAAGVAAPPIASAQPGPAAQASSGCSAIPAAKGSGTSWVVGWFFMAWLLRRAVRRVQSAPQSVRTRMALGGPAGDESPALVNCVLNKTIW